MKKLLFIILIVLLLALNVYTVMKGLELGGLEILGLKGIQDKNNTLDTTIAEATKLASTDYPNALTTIETDAKKLETEKQNYEDMVTVSSGDDIAAAKQLTKYNIEFLWTKIGTHATSEGVTIKMDVTKGTSSTAETYNLNFTVTGSYIGISDFISSIENDSELGFKIEEFKMVPNTDTTELQATFVCKDIAIKDINAAGASATPTTSTNTGTSTTNPTTTNANSTNTTNANDGSATSTTQNSNTTTNNKQ